MKVAIFTSHLLLASHYETELEIILEHQNKGDQITQLVCNKELPSCDINPYHLFEACERCVSKRQKGINLLPKKIIQKSFLNLREEDKNKIAIIPTDFDNVKELQSLWVDNFDVGFAVASSLISITRNSNPPLEKLLLKRYILSSVGVYYSLINYIKEFKPDIIYVFNGRFAHTKAAFRACKKMGVPCRLHERGNSLNYYSVFENTGIHDSAFFQNQIEISWQQAKNQEKQVIAEKWFNTRIGGTMENWYSFLEDQILELPKGWDSNKKNVLICNSSEDEIASLGEEWEHPIYKTQPIGIRKIVEDCSSNPNLHFYLRIHPYLVNVDTEDVRELHSLSSPNLTVIPSKSRLSTYKLVEQCEITVTFGSTIGVEATYMRKPSILLSKSFYDRIDVAYIPDSHEDALNFLKLDLSPKPLENALKFGYYSATFGKRFRFYEPEDFGKGKFRGQRVEHSKGLKYLFINKFYKNNLFPKLSDRIWYWKRDRVLKQYLPE